MASQTGQQITGIHRMSNISRSKDNQEMKFDDLTEYKMRNIFPKKSYTHCGGKGSL